MRASAARSSFPLRLAPAIAGLALAPGGLAAPAPSAPAAPPVALPKMVVRAGPALPSPESWRYARIDGFEVLSNASEGASVSLVRNFEEFRRALAIAWPPARLQTEAPAVLLICGRGDKFARFLPPGGSTNPADVTWSYEDPDGGAIVLDAESKLVNGASTEAVAGAGMVEAAGADSNYAQNFGPTNGQMMAAAESGNLPGGGGLNAGLGASPLAGEMPQRVVDTNRELDRAYIRFVLDQADPPPPPWLEEGLAEILVRMRYSPAGISLGDLEQQFTESAIAGQVEEVDFNRALVHQHLMPLGSLFAVRADSALAREPTGTVWAAECCAFVHYCLFGEQGANRAAFLEFMGRIGREPLTDRLFKSCFGVGFGGMEIRLRGYINATHYTSIELKPHGGGRLPDVPQPEFRPATQAEVGRLEADVLRLAGRPKEAHEALRVAYLRGERDPRLLAALGLDDLSLGDAARGRELLQAAVASAVDDPRAYLELGRLRLQDALAHPAAGDKLSPEQMVGILRPLFDGRQLPPRSPEFYRLIVEAWAHSEVPPTERNLTVVDEGLRLFYRNTDLLMAAARLELQCGMRNSALELAAIGVRVAPDAGTARKFAALEASLAPGAAK